MQNTNFVGELGQRLCNSIINLDPSIIVASIGSSSGEELASANRPSMSVLIGSDPNLRKNYASVIASQIDSFKVGEHLLGQVNRIVTTFEKTKVIVVPHLSDEVFVAVITTRDSESNKIAFEILKLIERYSGI
jgi:hypothetical protein